MMFSRLFVRLCYLYKKTRILLFRFPLKVHEKDRGVGREHVRIVRRCDGPRGCLARRPAFKPRRSAGLNFLVPVCRGGEVRGSCFFNVNLTPNHPPIVPKCAHAKENMSLLGLAELSRKLSRHEVTLAEVMHLVAQLPFPRFLGPPS